MAGHNTKIANSRLYGGMRFGRKEGDEGHGEVVTYHLSPEELARYRGDNFKPKPKEEKQVAELTKSVEGKSNQGEEEGEKVDYKAAYEQLRKEYVGMEKEYTKQLKDKAEEIVKLQKELETPKPLEDDRLAKLQDKYREQQQLLEGLKRVVKVIL